MTNWLADREQRRVSVRRSLFPALLVFLFLQTLCVEQFEIIVFLEPLERLRTALEKTKLFVKQFCVASGLSLCSLALNIKDWRADHFPLSDNPRSLKLKSELCASVDSQKNQNCAEQFWEAERVALSGFSERLAKAQAEIANILANAEKKDGLWVVCPWQFRLTENILDLPVSRVVKFVYWVANTNTQLDALFTECENSFRLCENCVLRLHPHRNKTVK